MAKKKSSDHVIESKLSIEGNVATWELRGHGDIEGTYMGTFKFVCYLLPIQKLRAGLEQRSLIGPHPELMTDSEKFLAFALSQLKYRIVSAPPFWTSTDEMPGNVPDEEIVNKVITAALEAEMLFKQQKKKEKLDALNRAKKAAEKLLSDAEGNDEGKDQEIDD